ncbi:hypothetical protein [Croceicoccus sp. YJ47]|uniref:hypothetical protein n=1 Tax=Croceicoccus sp. YJ47 TaxID=2798724 RepID=UPI00192380CC|nr:hypothetical protein [Croceicoccus sp. YJ47]QQN75031.1 hypothetical protein JD971_04865 [Croceicoccus sp. YJ47]
MAGLDDMKNAAPIAAPDMTAAEGAPEADGHGPQLPQPCPVTPLGVLGSKIQFLDRLNQLQTVATECRKNDMTLWFGDGYLIGHFPQYKKGKDGEPGDVDGFNQKTASAALVEDCATKGIFNPAGRVFGRGAHVARGDEDQMVLHLGSKLLIANAPDKKGKRRKDVITARAGALDVPGHGTLYFPARPSLPPIADKASAAADGRELLSLLGKWYWVDPDASTLLLLDGIAQMFICGALPWRSHIWLAGPTAAGKSSLQTLIRSIHDGDWCLHTEDSSERRLRQTLDNDTLPVLIDEAEAHDNPEKLKNILNLMKKGSSGGKIHRGGADDKGHEFVVRSSFILSSVLHASMRGEDRNRIAILEMREVPLEVPPLELEEATWRVMGRRMHRRMIDQWPRYLHTLNLYKRAIAAQRYEGRWQDTYGTLLACADLLLYDTAPDSGAMHEEGMERIHSAVAKILPMMTRGKSEARTDVERVQMHLMSHMLPGAHGKPGEPVGVWLDRAMKTKVVPGQFETSPVQEGPDHDAREKLKSHGLRVIEVEPNKSGGWKFGGDAKLDDAGWAEGYLAVAYSTNKALAEIFRGSEWAGDGYLQSLGKIPGAKKGIKIRFAGRSAPDNALAVPLAALMGGDE